MRYKPSPFSFPGACFPKEASLATVNDLPTFAFRSLGRRSGSTAASATSRGCEIWAMAAPPFIASGSPLITTCNGYGDGAGVAADTCVLSGLTRANCEDILLLRCQMG